MSNFRVDTGLGQSHFWVDGLWPRRINPDGGGQSQRLWLAAHKAFGMERVSLVQDLLALGLDVGGLTKVNHRWGEQAEAGVMGFPVVPVPECRNQAQASTGLPKRSGKVG